MSECVVYGCTNPVGEGLKHGCGHHFHGDFNQTVLIEHDPTLFTFAPILKPLGLVSLRPEQGPFLKADILGLPEEPLREFSVTVERMVRVWARDEMHADELAHERYEGTVTSVTDMTDYSRVTNDEPPTT